MTGAMGHLFLIGFMGTGKTVVGRALAVLLGRSFLDLDQEIEARCGRRIVEIFRDEGEAGFREREESVLGEVVKSAAAVIALGGGAPAVPSMASMVRGRGRTVLLTANWPVLWERVRKEDTRPLLSPILNRSSNEDAASRLEDFVAFAEPILQTRQEAYASLAEFTIDTTHHSVAEVAKQIGLWLRDQETMKAT